MRALPRDAYDAALSFDPAALHRWIAAAGAVPEAIGWVRWAEVWQALLEGAWERAGELAAALEASAAADHDAALVIEAAAQRALAACGARDLAQATSIARRASRMARTEAIPEQEYTAHLVLSRVRRLTGHPHLSTRILGALGRVAPAAWQPWVRWELLMAGAFEVAFPHGLDATMPGSGPAADAAAALGAVQAAAEAGDRALFDAWSDELTRVTRWALLADEADALLTACDVRRSPADAEVTAWCEGRTPEGPSYLHGVLTRGGSAPLEESAIAYVLAEPTGLRKRVPRLGWGLARRQGVQLLPQGRRKQGRVETLVSALALAGDGGMDEPACFAETYGFAYEPEVHKNIFHVLLHRARDYLGDAGSIEVGAGRIRLALSRPILVPDPRCTKPMQDRLLRAVAEQRGATAKDIAKAVGVSLRVAQAALHELSTDGACEARREGRMVRYVVEDTTFSEPTML